MYYNIFGYTRKAKIKKADIQYQIAKTYAAQGNQKDAMNALGTGVMYLQSDFGIYNRTVADYLSNQSADFFISVGDTNRAANVANQAQFIYNKVGITPNDTAALHRIYGKIAFVRNEYNNAFENYQNALDILRNTAEVNHSTYVKTILDIGEYYEHFNHSDLAISIYNEGIKKLDKDLVVAGHNRIALLIKLGKLYKATEKYNKAQPLYEEAIRLIEKLPRTDLLHASIDDLYTELLAIYGETK
ncbi:MAG TPA: tetratricopeptide repeat protein, partial [Candidatus Kapabacteria bacterium]|nr:tetratricopeptide repeat protein [Candidatus Kapabacteria bacterium]